MACFRHLLLVPLVGVLVALLGACSRPLQTAVPNPIEIDATEYPRVFRAAMDVLHDQGFILDRESYRFGQVTTKPLPAPTVLEPWKPSSATAYQAWQATINDQRRIVAVRMTPLNFSLEAWADQHAGNAGAPPATQPGSTFHLGVEVDIQQAQLPDRRLGGSTSGPEIINTFTDTPAELRARGIKGPYWQNVGRDPFLEQIILAAVIRRSTQAPPPSSPQNTPSAPDGPTSPPTSP